MFKEIIVGVAFSLHASFSFAATPRNGILMSSDGSILQYDCEPDGNEKIICSFIQSSLNQKEPAVSPEKMDETIKSMIEDFANEDMPCSEWDAYKKALDHVSLEQWDDAVSALVGQEVDAERFIQEVKEYKTRQMEDLRDLITVSLNMCRSTSKKTLRALLEHTNKMDTRTCKATINPFEQSFKRISDTVWVVAESSATGTCGTVRLDRFECGDESYLCNYISEKRITNKSGGYICSILDEQPLKFSWEKSEHYLECDIIKS